MNDRPTVDELLEAVRDYLVGEVASSAPDHRARFRALIAANVLAIVRRELVTDVAGADRDEELRSILALLGEHAEDALVSSRNALEAANRRLAAHIRAGGADSGDHARAVRDVVVRQVERKLAVSNPEFLQRFHQEQ